MKNLIGIAAISILAALPACKSHVRWEQETAEAARMLEVQLDAKGMPTEIEYHVAPESVPAVVRQAMDKLHPGGAFDDAEKESHGGNVYWELSRKVNGMAVEAMFTPDGALHEEEIEVPSSKVPAAVRERASASLAGGQAAKWEEMRNAKREVTEYHVKMSRGGSKFKLMISTDGKLLGIVREVPSEIEVQFSGS